MTFDEALKIWAKKYLEDEYSWRNLRVAEVLKVEVDYEEGTGYCHTCWEDARLFIEITYRDSSGELKDFNETEYSSLQVGQFQLLQELFKED